MLVSTDLWYGTEVEDTLVLYVWHVFQYIWHLLKSISDEQVETVDSLFDVGRITESFQFRHKLTPCLYSQI